MTKEQHLAKLQAYLPLMVEAVIGHHYKTLEKLVEQYIAEVADGKT